MITLQSSWYQRLHDTMQILLHIPRFIAQHRGERQCETRQVFRRDLSIVRESAQVTC